MRIPRFISAVPLDPRRALLAAAILHVLFTLGVFSVGRLGLSPSQFDRDGIGEFARDSTKFREDANSLADTLAQGEVGSWINADAAVHVKLYSLDFVLLRRLLGSSILAVEPLNLFYYLALLALTFSLAQLVGGRGAAWLAAAIVGLWPSLLLHTTQFVRDPLIIAAILGLILLLTRLLKLVHTWRSAATDGLIVTLVCFLIWWCRRDMWPVIIAVIVVTALLFIIRMVRERKLLAANLAVMALVCGLAIAIPQTRSNPPPVVVGDSTWVPRPVRNPAWGVIGRARQKFIAEGLRKSGSIIDADVNFFGPTDTIKYVPRALEIGYLSPFPTMWFTPGFKVGMTGRLLGGVETLLTYLMEALACVFIWRRRRNLETWLLFLVTTIGVLALGMVVVNLGTLYRMRYPFWILIVIMAASVLGSWIAERKIQHRDTEIAQRSTEIDSPTDFSAGARSVGTSADSKRSQG